MEPAVTDVFVHVTQSASWVQVAAPVAAFLAAGASWRSSIIARRSQADADLPQLVFHVFAGSGNFPLTVKLENVGRGVAIMPGFTVLSGAGEQAANLLEGNLAQNGAARFGLPFPTTEAGKGIAFCEDRYNNVHVWSAQKKYRRYRKSKKQELTPRQMFRDMYDGFDVGNTPTLPAPLIPG